MSEIKERAQGINPYIEARNVFAMSAKGGGNIYESLNVIGSRSRQISVELKRELHSKLEEFASATDTLEEVHENKEQIEISKFYERLPNPAIIALNEFMNDELEYRMREDEEEA
ncbi:DNA-directed RNA polymerase subunit omega [Saprospira grandis]|uniref:DNA-directed RNA polymerase, omega subunit n=1 Tax=Saprospira grandis (strain Lewin) TaxID=984262 RepID=H6L6M8_SAPGL|nr:DNA-directed RNA polymerase subunit omega [Saprospira grandis]AFC25274.1 DNA-directed RNA polymerase, omega subunit [Saprospira grandis str. Lewin]WBM73362.1 DNA-directed RNA polymerase subunit omega [Saprospira grandis]